MIREKTINQTEAETQEVLKKLDWTVSLHPMRHPITSEKTDFYGIVRNDNNALLSSGLSKHYNPLQNAEIIDLAKTFVNGFADQKMTIKDTFSIDHGTTNSIVIQAGKYDLGGGDVIIPQIVLSNNHDGKGKMTAKATILREWCENGACTVIASMSTVAISHKGDTKSKLLEAHTIVQQMTTAHEITKNIFAQMKGIKFTADQLVGILRKGEKVSDLSTQKNNEIDQIMSYFQDADQGKIERDTTWNGWNAATRFFNHDSVQRVQQNSGNTREGMRSHSIYNGRIAKQSQDIFEQVISASESWSMIDAMIAETERPVIQSVSVEDILAEMGV
jgi:hypothetical protein